MKPEYDIAIIGGGINGCACAADAAMRGLSVILIEKGDLASQTSSSSTKLIHGGLRYLEQHQWKLVKKSLDERQLLLNMAPHLVHPQSIFMPYQKEMRPFWLLRAGLFLYDHLSCKNRLPKSQSIKRHLQSRYFTPLDDIYTKGFIFHDAKTDDARLTVENAIQAKHHGANIQTYTTLTGARSLHNAWELETLSSNNEKHIYIARSIINATGPWVNEIASMLEIPANENITWVKGSHIVLPALYSGNHGYLLQNVDKRIIFVLPFHGYTMIGTTDTACAAPGMQPSIDNDEISYLCSAINQFFRQKIQPDDVIHSWSGIRTLRANSEESLSRLSRDYTFYLTHKPAPAITVYGGKITTYRKLAEEVLNTLAPVLENKNLSCTSHIPLPGALHWNANLEMMQNHFNWLPKNQLQRYIETYGIRTSLMLADVHDMDELGIHIGKDVYENEVRFLVQEEWAKTSEDILWRRGKLGLVLNSMEKEKLHTMVASMI